MTECNSIVYNNYVAIHKHIKKRYNELINQLSNYGLTDLSNKPFIDLINRIEDIPTVERYYEDNIKPLDDPKMYLTEKPYKNYTEFNMALAEQLNYYMRLLGYYLILKGVSIENVNKATDLETRISLLKFIMTYKVPGLTVNTNKEFIYKEKTTIPYALHDVSGNNITNGILVLKQGKKIIARVNAGQDIYITPNKIGENNYILEYEGYEQYEPTSISFTINVLPGTPQVNINSFTSCDIEEKYIIVLQKDTEEEQVGVTINLKAMVMETNFDAISDKKVYFYANNQLIGEGTTGYNGVVTTQYTITKEEDIVIRATTGEQVSNYFIIQLTSYFNKIKEKLSNVTYVFTKLEEDENGNIVSISKNTSDITTVNDLNGIIYDMWTTENNWGYKVFNTDRNYITKEEFNELMNILIDYQDNGEDIIITTLGDSND